MPKENENRPAFTSLGDTDAIELIGPIRLTPYGVKDGPVAYAEATENTTVWHCQFVAGSVLALYNGARVYIKFPVETGTADAIGKYSEYATWKIHVAIKEVVDARGKTVASASKSARGNVTVDAVLLAEPELVNGTEASYPRRYIPDLRPTERRESGSVSVVSNILIR